MLSILPQSKFLKKLLGLCNCAVLTSFISNLNRSLNKIHCNIYSLQQLISLFIVLQYTCSIYVLVIVDMNHRFATIEATCPYILLHHFVLPLKLQVSFKVLQYHIFGHIIMNFVPTKCLPIYFVHILIYILNLAAFRHASTTTT